MTEPAPTPPALDALIAELQDLTAEAMEANPAAQTRALLALPHVCAEVLHALHGRDFRAFVVTGDDIPAFSRLFHALYPVTPLNAGTGERRAPE